MIQNIKSTQKLRTCKDLVTERRDKKRGTSEGDKAVEERRKAWVVWCSRKTTENREKFQETEKITSKTNRNPKRKCERERLI